MLRLITDNLEFVTEPAVDDDLGDDVVVLNTNGDRSEASREALNDLLKVRAPAPGYEVVSNGSEWMLNRRGVCVPYYDGIWV